MTRPTPRPSPWRSRLRYCATLPERTVRALAAGLFGTVHETAELILPRLVRRSKLYEVTAKNALRIAIELVGGVEGARPADATTSAGQVAVRKAAGNVVELGSIAAFGFSPLWLLAGASDILRGSRVYLQALEEELAKAGFLKEGTHFGSVDELLGALESTSGRTAGIIDTPPLELAEIRRSVAELKDDATTLPSPDELATLFKGLVRIATSEGRSLLEVSSGVGFAFLFSARNVTRRHLLTPYSEDWQPLRKEGFGAYAIRISGPYRAAVTGHFDPAKLTWTERGATRAWSWRRWRPRRRRANPPNSYSSQPRACRFSNETGETPTLSS